LRFLSSKGTSERITYDALQITHLFDRIAAKRKRLQQNARPARCHIWFTEAWPTAWQLAIGNWQLATAKT
jgi:hypothetical protein